MDEKEKDVLVGKKWAEKVVEENYLTEPPVDIYSLVQNYGLSVWEKNYADNAIAGSLNLSSRRIVLNEEDGEKLQRFSLAHELGHWLMHREEIEKNPELRILYKKPLGEETDPLEIQANAFATYLLVPEAWLPHSKDLPDNTLAHLFKVTQSVIGFIKKNGRK